jgi:hypothetical protein
MDTFRGHLRALTLICLALQTATLAAFVPRDCCAAHASHAAQPPADERASCPMHRASQRSPACSLRGACNGPLSALPMVWSNPAVPPHAVSILPDPAVSRLGDVHPRPPIDTDSHPETPPPRA